MADEVPEAEKPAEPVVAEPPKARKVRWTILGEELCAHSEHGMHTSGDIVETIYADILIKRGFATEIKGGAKK